MNTLEKDIVVNATNAGYFTTFTNALKAAGLEAGFKGPGPFTFFAPTDEAFKKLPAGAIEALLKDKAKLAGILNLHVIKGNILAKDIKSHDLKSIQGEPLTTEPTDTGFTINGIKSSKHEIEASNGVIHGIDTVMMPKH